MKTYTRQILLGVVLLGAVIGASLIFSGGLKHSVPTPVDNNLTSMPVTSAKTHASYIRLSREEMFQQADVIAVGQVKKVSSTQFNQDSGELWEATMADAMPMALHYVDVQIDNVLVDVVGLEGHVTIAVLGTSPMESSLQAAHQLKSGDRVIVFLNFAELAWREGTRPVWRFIGAPAESALVLQDDGLYHDSGLDEAPLTLEALTLQLEQQR